MKEKSFFAVDLRKGKDGRWNSIISGPKIAAPFSKADMLAKTMGPAITTGSQNRNK